MKPPREQPALPGLPKGATQRPKRDRYASSWTPDQRQFADAMIAHWSQVFKGVAGGSRANLTRHNRFVAIQFYRWNQEQPAEERFSDEAVCRAIEGYRDNPTMRKMVDGGHTQYKPFGSWFGGDVADNIDRQLTRLGLPRTQTGADARSTRSRQFAQDLLESSGLDRAAANASSVSIPLFEQIIFLHAAALRSACRSGKTTAEFYGRLARLVERFDAELPLAKARYRKRGSVGFGAITGRSSKEDSQEDANLVDALALALFDRDTRKELAKTPPRKGAVACA